MQRDRAAEGGHRAIGLRHADGAGRVGGDGKVRLRAMGFACHGDDAGRLGRDIGEAAEGEGPSQNELLRRRLPAAMGGEVDILAMHGEAGEL